MGSGCRQDKFEHGRCNALTAGTRANDVPDVATDSREEIIQLKSKTNPAEHFIAAHGPISDAANEMTRRFALPPPQFSHVLGKTVIDQVFRAVRPEINPIVLMALMQFFITGQERTVKPFCGKDEFQFRQSHVNSFNPVGCNYAL